MPESSPQPSDEAGDLFQVSGHSDEAVESGTGGIHMTKRDIPMIIGAVLIIAALASYIADGRTTEAMIVGALWLVLFGTYMVVRRRRNAAT